MSGPLDTPLVPEPPSVGRPAGWVNREAVLALAAELVRIDTCNPPGGELAAARHLAVYLEAAGLEVTLLPFGDGRGNLVARVRGSGDEPGLLLSGHLDTVPVGDPGAWSVPAHGGEVRDGRLYGRGALDMKGAVAAMSVAAASIASFGQTMRGDVVLAFTAGEETDSCGAKSICAEGHLDDVGFGVIGEPTDLDIGIAHRGALWVRADAEGDAGHSSQPSLGRNAVNELLGWLHPPESLEELISEPTDSVLGSGSVSLNIIGGGSSANMIPTRAHAVLDFRTVPGADHRQIIKDLEARLGAVELTVLRDSIPIAIGADHPLVRAAETAISANGTERAVRRGLPYLTDGSIFGEALGIPMIVLGPGTEHDAHTDDESVEVVSLERAAAIYGSIAWQLMYENPHDTAEE